MEDNSSGDKKRLKTITSFFRPVPISKNEDTASASSEPRAGPSNFNTVMLPVQTTSTPFRATQGSSCLSPNVPLTRKPSTSASPNLGNFPNDIGNYIGEKISDLQKYQLIENPWKPPSDYNFPHSIHNKNGKEVRRFLGHQHLEKYNWLVFSPSQQGLFCKYCPWFTVGNVAGGQKTVPLQKLVTKPLTSFAKLLGEKGDLEEHSNKKYHKEAVLSGKLFFQSFKDPELDVRNQVDRQRLEQVEENRRRLKPILETIIFLGRQNIALRGHRDDGRLDPSSISVCNEGNFRELLRFRVSSGDTTLEEHLKTSSSRATYISKSIQNDLIKCCGEEILNEILAKIRGAGFYSILFDETTDLSHKSQISLVIRYFSNGMIREDFVGFVDAFEEIGIDENETTNENDIPDELSLTGEELGHIVLRQMKKLSLPLQNCIGIGTDGCSVMVSQAKGAVYEIQKEATNAIRCPCYNHALNLSLSKCNCVSSIRNAVGTMKEVISFFSSSAKRNCVLKKHLGAQLSGLCETRWVERHDGIIQFYGDLPKIISALDEISTWRDSSTSSKASVLSTALASSTFLVSLICLSDLLALTLPLSKGLQKPNFDLSYASSVISDTISVLQNRRAEADTYFNGIWKKAKDVAQSVGVDLFLPRLCGRQTQRANYGVNNTTLTAEDYYRISVFLPLLDYIINDLTERFSDPVLDLYKLSFLLPNEIRPSKFESKEKQDAYEDGCVAAVVGQFGVLLNVSEECGIFLLKGEYTIWKNKWMNTKKPVKNVIDVLEECDVDVLPMIRQLLLIIVTLPISVASSERSFSALRRLKSWLRSQITQERLTGLALLHVHRDIEVSIDNVIDNFARSERRVQFVI